jgi:probable rRNA maturation factor
MAEPGPSRSNKEAQLDIEVIRHAEVWDGSSVTDAMLSGAANAAFSAASPTGGGSYEITILLTDDREMRELNRLWRGKDSSTNVLSFPAGEPLDTVNCEAAPLGDVVLAAETVLAEASQQGISIADHVSHLVVHGVLHLLGHDHERDEDAEAMETLETEILASLGVADPYAEAGDAPLAELAR